MVTFAFIHLFFPSGSMLGLSAYAAPFLMTATFVVVVVFKIERGKTRERDKERDPTALFYHF